MSFNGDGSLPISYSFDLLRDGLEIVMGKCRTELDCRKALVDVLKKMRGQDLWTQGFNWNEDLELKIWDGEDYGRKRIVVNNDGMITELRLNDLNLCGEWRSH